jgi:hypothetical protein
MAANAISHYHDHAVHGPVVMFVSDDGQILLRCEIDGQVWTLPTSAVPHSAKPSREHVQHVAVDVDHVPEDIEFDDRDAEGAGQLARLRASFDAPEIWRKFD